MAFDPLIVLKGEFKMGADSGTAVTYKAEVTSVELVRTRDLVEIPATWGTGIKEQRAGAVAQELRINMINDPQSSSLWAELWAQMDDADGQRYFEVVLKDGAVSASNPKFSGTCIVTGASIGGASGSVSQNSITMPIVGTITKATA